MCGTVEKADIKKLAQKFEDKFEGNDRVNLAVDMTPWSDMTGDAIAEDIKFELGQLGKVSRVPRMAIVSDKQFVQAVMKFIRPLFPMVEVKTFGAQEYAKALTFASEMPAAKTKPRPRANRP